jgi:protein-S-isoprenylcysteine O-methyltransferase Ste14
VSALTVAFWLLRRQWPAGLTAWAQSVIVLVPISGVIHSGYQLAADRYSYLSGLGLSVLVGAGLVWILQHAAGPPGRRWMRPLAWASAALLVVALGRPRGRRR